MDDKQIPKQLEFYSNATVGFIVMQSLAFCYTLGTSDRFSNILITHKLLSVGLTAIFLGTAVLAFFFNYLIAAKLQQLAPEYSRIIKIIYLIKLLVIVAFSAMLMMITLKYAVFAPVP